MFKFYTIQSNSGYKLSALVDENGFDMVSLTKESDHKKGFDVEIDNPRYIIHTLLPKLKRPRKISEKSIVLGIPISNIPQVIEIIEEGIKVGFFNKYKENNNE